MLFTFEGIDGSGKSTAVKNVFNTLKKESMKVEKTFEPGDGGICADLRSLIIDRKEELNSFETTALFLCERSNHVRRKIRPWLTQGKTVLCDRFIASTMVYQGYLNNLNDVELEHLYTLNKKAIHPINIRAMFYFDVSPETAINRIRSRMDKDAYDSLDPTHYEKLILNYKKFFKDFIEAIYINAERSEAEIAEEISFYIRKAINK